MDFYRMVRRRVSRQYPVVNRRICYSTKRDDYRGRMAVCKRVTMLDDQNKRGDRARARPARLLRGLSSFPR